MDLPLILALAVAFCIVIYVLADGYDLGIGILFLIAPRELDRDVMMASVSPFWDGNETWLVMGGTLLLAAFPIAYSVLLPAFYLPVIVMLFALILRGVAFGFRYKADRFQRVWDFAFAGGSLLAAMSQGLILGGLIQGVPMKDSAFAGGHFSFLTILGFLSGIGLVGGYALLGAGWLILKTSGSTETFGREVGHAALILVASMMVVVSAWTALTEPAVTTGWFEWPEVIAFALFPAGFLVVALVLWRGLWSHREAGPFGLAILLFLLGFAGLVISLWPYVIPYQVTVVAGAADRVTLQIAGTGMAVVLPFVLAYLAHCYWVFRGKVASDSGQEADSQPSAASRRSSSMDSGLHLS